MSTGKVSAELLEGVYPDKVKHVCHVLRLITKRDMPTCSFESEEYRSCTKFSSPMCGKLIREKCVN